MNQISASKYKKYTTVVTQGAVSAFGVKKEIRLHMDLETGEFRFEILVRWIADGVWQNRSEGFYEDFGSVVAAYNELDPPNPEGPRKDDGEWKYNRWLVEPTRRIQ